MLPVQNFIGVSPQRCISKLKFKPGPEQQKAKNIGVRACMKVENQNRREGVL